MSPEELLAALLERCWGTPYADLDRLADLGDYQLRAVLLRPPAKPAPKRGRGASYREQFYAACAAQGKDDAETDRLWAEYQEQRECRAKSRRK